MMSEIAALRLLIEKGKEKVDKLDRQIMTEWKLLEEAEEHKHKMMIEILQARVGRIAGENAQKEKDLIEIEKHISINIRGSFTDGEQICCKCKFFIFVWYLFIYTSVLTDRYVIYIYIYILWSSCVIYCFSFYDRKR